MKLYTTKDKHNPVTLKEAVLKGLPDDNGLYVLDHIPRIPSLFFERMKEMTFPEVALTVAYSLIDNAIPTKQLEEIVFSSIDFPAPVVSLDKGVNILELFHGPTLAFKDFGARFMARMMGYFNQSEDKELTILVATSGDTGGAVAAGFYDTPGIEVIILYPKGKVSHLQEKQLTTLGKNISAVEIDGSFDDCQALVKQAFLDTDVTAYLRLSSANSINIARLIPQTFYYFEAWKQMYVGKAPVFVVPSGNFGNITAGLFAQKLGLPVKKFIAANNANDIFFNYLKSGKYSPKSSVQTISNAMDVGNPSNFYRILDLFSSTWNNDNNGSTWNNEERGSTWNNINQHIDAYSFSDASTLVAIQEVFDKYGYIIDPHGAVGYLALKEHQKKSPKDIGIILETAHPSKFLDVMPTDIAGKVLVPARLACLKDKQKVATSLSKEYAEFKGYLLSR